MMLMRSDDRVFRRKRLHRYRLSGKCALNSATLLKWSGQDYQVLDGHCASDLVFINMHESFYVITISWRPFKSERFETLAKHETPIKRTVNNKCKFAFTFDINGT